MNCRYYFDAILVDSPRPYFHRLATLMRRLHQTGVANECRFAIDFPNWMKNSGTPGAKIRVFLEDKAMAGSFKDGLDDAVDDDLVMTGSVKEIDAAAIKGWVNVLRIREPSKIKPTLDPDLDERNRQRAERKRQANKLLPSVPLHSSSGHLMPIFIDRVVAVDGEGGEPGSYGLSRITRRVRVPIL